MFVSIGGETEDMSGRPIGERQGSVMTSKGKPFIYERLQHHSPPVAQSTFQRSLKTPT
jgi:hypothetical protein